MKQSHLVLGPLLAGASLMAAEFHVSPMGNNGNDGSPAHPFQTIAAAALKAMPGDTVLVHAGTYRERVDPPRGGEAGKPITYAAAPGEKVVITGSEAVKGWEKVSGDTWKVVIPSKSFGNFNPYSDRIRGDWFDPKGRVHHTGCVYLNGDWMIEARQLADVMKPAGKTPLWFASVDGDNGQFLANIAWFKAGAGTRVNAGEPAFRYGGKAAPCTEGGTCSGFNLNGYWLRFDGVDFGAASDGVEFRTATAAGDTLIELREGTPEGELLGTCTATATGDWQKWQSFTAKIKPTSGKKTLCLTFKSPAVDAGNTTIHAQFPGGVNPNEAQVEINQRQTVFYPSKNFINHITVRGFTLENAATNWAPPSSEQMGIIGTNWSKGWVIENNTVRHSKCSGIALGKYGDGTDNTNDAGAADPYTRCVRDAIKNGWNKATIGSHVVRNNTIYQCEQTGVVGSMGCAFSTVEDNEIHDIDSRKLFGGCEQAGIKFHGAVDVVIRHNHIHHTNGIAGIWLDWMAQGTRVTGNLLHDNGGSFGDMFLEMNHGPYLLDNNIFLSEKLSMMSHGGAYVHNLFGGGIRHLRSDGRNVPFLAPHGTEIAGIHTPLDDDHRYCNNMFLGGNGLAEFDRCAPGAVAVRGNLYANGIKSSKHEANPGAVAASVPFKLETRDDGMYLVLTTPALPDGFKTSAVSTATLGEAQLVKQGFTNPDGSPLMIDTDYFGKKRDAAKPSVGPFENPGSGTTNLKVWPRH
jgi:hypothetical protein